VVHSGGAAEPRFATIYECPAVGELEFKGLRSIEKAWLLGLDLLGGGVLCDVVHAPCCLFVVVLVGRAHLEIRQNANASSRASAIPTWLRNHLDYN
jgi:hypothetical protein